MSKPTNASWVIIGRPESGYSLKVRSTMRYKKVPYTWKNHCLRTQRLFQKHATVQLIPLVFRPDGSTLQDSTPIIEELERTYPTPALHPPDPTLRFLSELLEDLGDEWGNKLMFHHRWGYPADQKHRANSLARGMFEGLPLGFLAPVLAPAIVRRMIPRMAFAGANDNNAPQLIESFRNLVALLEAHLSERSYLFGARPAFGDLGVWGQLYQASIDPTCGNYLQKHGTAVLAWIERMLDPVEEGSFETLASLEPTLRPIFATEVGPRFLAWSAANARAWEAREERTELTMCGRLYYQKTFKYPAGTLALLREHYAASSENPELSRFLETTGCLPFLR